MIAVDTNLLVRLVTADDLAQAKSVERYLAKHASASRPAYVDAIVLCELSWVLERSYGYPRADVCVAIAAIAAQPYIKVDAAPQVNEALSLFETGPADFADYLIAIRARDAGFAPTITLDKRAAKSPLHELLK